MGTAAMVTNFCGLHASINGSVQQVVRGVADDILERRSLDGPGEPHPVKATGGGHDIAAQAYDTSAYKMAADDLLLSAGVDIRFHSFAVGVAMNGPCIDAVLVDEIGPKGDQGGDVHRPFGDGDLAYWSGAECEKGDATGSMAYPTTMFRVANADDEKIHNEGKPNSPN